MIQDKIGHDGGYGDPQEKQHYGQSVRGLKLFPSPEIYGYDGRQDDESWIF